MRFEKKRGKERLKRERPKRLITISSALWQSISLFTVFILTIVEIVCYFTVVATMNSRMRENIMFAGNEVCHFLEKENCDDVAAAELIQKYLYKGITVSVISDTGMQILPVPFNGEGDMTVELNEILSKLPDRQQSQNSSAVFKFGGNLNFAAPVKYKGENAYLLASHSLEITAAATRTLVIGLVVVALITSAVTFIVSFTLSQKLSRGLINITKSATKLAEGNYSVDFNETDYKEVARLSDSLNYVRDEVKKSDDFQKEILSNVSHDLKTPLTMIKAYASMIKEISGDNKDKREAHLQVIIDEADRLTSLVNDVLSVSKVNSKISELKLKVFNLTEFLYGIINKFSYLQETQGYTFLVDIDANLYTCADSEKIGQVIYNLLGNAVNYTGADKKVYISLKKSIDGERIKFSVRDTGEGISQEELKNIWERYYRAEGNHVRPVKGSGLGLNIVKVVLKNHSFDFGAESEKGKGSMFWVDFPVVPSEIDPEPEEE